MVCHVVSSPIRMWTKFFRVLSSSSDMKIEIFFFLREGDAEAAERRSSEGAISIWADGAERSGAERGGEREARTDDQRIGATYCGVVASSPDISDPVTQVPAVA
jgi:hypothetical protein